MNHGLAHFHFFLLVLLLFLFDVLLQLVQCSLVRFYDLLSILIEHLSKPIALFNILLSIRKHACFKKARSSSKVGLFQSGKSGHCHWQVFIKDLIGILDSVVRLVGFEIAERQVEAGGNLDLLDELGSL